MKTYAKDFLFLILALINSHLILTLFDINMTDEEYLFDSIIIVSITYLYLAILNRVKNR